MQKASISIRNSILIDIPCFNLDKAQCIYETDLSHSHTLLSQFYNLISWPGPGPAAIINAQLTLLHTLLKIIHLTPRLTNNVLNVFN